MLARENPELASLVERIHTIYFLATPHGGSRFAKTWSNVVNVSLGQKPFFAELGPSSQSIAMINDSFRQCSESLQLCSFYETNPTRILLTHQAIIVEKDSATLGFRNEVCCPLNADHRGICKFHGQTDPNYKTLRDAFSTSIDRILLKSDLIDPMV